VQRAICRILHHLCFSKENSFHATADFIDFIEFIMRESGRREKEREIDRQNREREKSIKHKIRTISLIHLAPVDLNHALPHIYFRYLQIYRYIYVHILWNRTAVLSCYCKIIVTYHNLENNFHCIIIYDRLLFTIIYDRFAFMFAMI